MRDTRALTLLQESLLAVRLSRAMLEMRLERQARADERRERGRMEPIRGVHGAWQTSLKH